MKFTNLLTLLNPKPTPMPKFDTHTQSCSITILNGQNFTCVSIEMNKLWGKNEAYLKWVLIGPVGKPFFLASVKSTNELSSLLKMAWREKRFLQVERGSMREKAREDLWKRKRARERAYRLMWEAKRCEVCGYWVLFRREVKSTTARLGIRS